MTGVAPFWQALAFSVVAYLLPIGLAWWLFGSKLPVAVGPVQRPSVKRNVVMALLLGAAGFSMWFGGLWDASKHALTGKVPGGADFLWAPHQMI